MSLDQEFIETVAESIVREYLSRKGLKSTLQVIDQECPRRQGSINNRNQLAKELHIQTLLNKNRDNEKPLRAILEIMTKFFLEQTPSVLERSAVKNAESLDLDFSSGAHLLQPTKNEVSSNGDKYMTSLVRPTTAVLTSRKERINDNSQDVMVDDDLDTSETLLGDGKGSMLSRETYEGLSINKISRPLSSKTRPGAIKSSVDDATSRHRILKSRTTNANSWQGQGLYQQEDPVAESFRGSDNQMTSQPSSGLWNELGLPQGNVPSAGSKPAVNRAEAPLKTKSASFQELLSAGEEKASQLSRRLSEKSAASLESGSGALYTVNSSSITCRPTSGKTGVTSKASGPRFSDLEVGDVEDLEEDFNSVQLQPAGAIVKGQPRKSSKQLDSKPIDTHTAIALKNLALGNAMQDYSDEWKLQSFPFCDLPGLQYGIVQKKGGPCGVLAAVQAVVLQEMLFGDYKLPQGSGLKPSRNERTKFLALALAKIFWKAGEQNRAVVALPSNQASVMGSTKFRQDDVTEKLMLHTFLNIGDLIDFMKDAVKQFEMEGNPGVVLCVYSTILSRGIDRVKKDMDEANGSLMGRHGYCTQELVNLLLNGEAVSNVFNDVKTLDSGIGPVTVLRGISSRSDIGLLSLFDHYKSCEVGTYLKTPKYPIWVVCSESHFSILFSTRLELVSDWKAERRFDLFYYDGLARQQEQIKLTVFTTSKYYQPPSDEELVPPLEHCIRTKWEGAEIDWNGTEPLL